MSDPPEDREAALLAAVVPLIHTRMDRLDQAAPMLRFLFVSDDNFHVDPDDAARILKPDARPVLSAARESLAALPQWELPAIEQALRSSLIEGLGLKPRLAFGPVRVAVTGGRVSPPLFESLELLGRESTLLRLQRSVEALS
jgi:glutamyl-tRNA synthetase